MSQQIDASSAGLGLGIKRVMFDEDVNPATLKICPTKTVFSYRCNRTGCDQFTADLLQQSNRLGCPVLWQEQGEVNDNCSARLLQNPSAIAPPSVYSVSRLSNARASRLATLAGLRGLLPSFGFGGMLAQ